MHFFKCASHLQRVRRLPYSENLSLQSDGQYPSGLFQVVLEQYNTTWKSKFGPSPFSPESCGRKSDPESHQHTAATYKAAWKIVRGVSRSAVLSGIGGLSRTILWCSRSNWVQRASNHTMSTARCCSRLARHSNRKAFSPSQRSQLCKPSGGLY